VADSRSKARFSFLIRIHWYNLLNHQDFRATVGPYQREAALYVQVNNFRMRRYPGVGFGGLSEMDSFRTRRKNRPMRDRQRSSKFQWRESASQAWALKKSFTKNRVKRPRRSTCGRKAVVVFGVCVTAI